MLYIDSKRNKYYVSVFLYIFSTITLSIFWIALLPHAMSTNKFDDIMGYSLAYIIALLFIVGGTILSTQAIRTVNEVLIDGDKVLVSFYLRGKKKIDLNTLEKIKRIDIGKPVFARFWDASDVVYKIYFNSEGYIVLTESMSDINSIMSIFKEYLRSD